MANPAPYSIPANPYTWPHDASFHPSTTALIIIDMQRDFCEQGGYLSQQGYDISATRAIIPRLQAVLAAFRWAGFAVVHTREGHGAELATLGSRERFRSQQRNSGGGGGGSRLGIGDAGPLGRLLVRGEAGHATVAELRAAPGEPVVDKPGKGAFTHTDLELVLRTRGVRNLVLCGVTTDVCVHSTLREANDRGFDCLLLEDGCAASEQWLHDAAVAMVRTEGGIFGATATVQVVREEALRLMAIMNTESIVP